MPYYPIQASPKTPVMRPSHAIIGYGAKARKCPPSVMIISWDCPTLKEVSYPTVMMAVFTFYHIYSLAESCPEV
jgi:hypothetical protein